MHNELLRYQVLQTNMHADHQSLGVMTVKHISEILIINTDIINTEY